jgi:hypothetical protein
MTCSKAENASWAMEARAPPTSATLDIRPGPDSRAARAAWQIGHHWHSGDSSGGGSLVAVSHTSPRSRRSWPTVLRTWSATWLAMLRAPARISQRWKSAIGSLPRRAWPPPPPPDWPLDLD